MKKLVCKYCGNAKFYVLNLEETICKCGYILTKLSDYKVEESEKEKEYLINSVYQLKAEVISKTSLLKREIDICLDEGNKEKFKNLSSELNDYEEILKAETQNSEFPWVKKFEQDQDKV